MSRRKVYSNPINVRLEIEDYEKFIKLKEKEKTTTGELARKLIHASLLEVKTDE